MGTVSRGVLTALLLLAVTAGGALAFDIRSDGNTGTDGMPRYTDPDAALPSFGQDDGAGNRTWRSTEGSFSFGMQMQSGDHAMQGYRRSPVMNDDSFFTRVPNY